MKEKLYRMTTLRSTIRYSTRMAIMRNSRRKKFAPSSNHDKHIIVTCNANTTKQSPCPGYRMHTSMQWLLHSVHALLLQPCTYKMWHYHPAITTIRSWVNPRNNTNNMVVCITALSSGCIWDKQPNKFSAWSHFVQNPDSVITKRWKKIGIDKFGWLFQGYKDIAGMDLLNAGLKVTYPR